MLFLRRGTTRRNRKSKISEWERIQVTKHNSYRTGTLILPSGFHCRVRISQIIKEPSLILVRYCLLYLVHLISVWGDRYRNISFANRSSSSASSLLSRTMKMSRHSLSTLSTFGISSNMMRYDMDVKNRRTNLPTNQTKPTYSPIILKQKRTGGLASVSSLGKKAVFEHRSELFVQVSCTWWL